MLKVFQELIIHVELLRWNLIRSILAPERMSNSVEMIRCWCYF